LVFFAIWVSHAHALARARALARKFIKIPLNIFQDAKAIIRARAWARARARARARNHLFSLNVSRR